MNDVVALPPPCGVIRKSVSLKLLILLRGFVAASPLPPVNGEYVGDGGLGVCLGDMILYPPVQTCAVMAVEFNVIVCLKLLHQFPFCSVDFGRNLI